MNNAPLLLIDKAPPVFVSLNSTRSLPFLSSSITALLLFCAISRPPSAVATMPSALLPSTLHRVFQRAPAATTPGIELTEYSRDSPEGGLNPGGGLKVDGAAGCLQVARTCGSRASRADCTPGPWVGAILSGDGAGGAATATGAVCAI